MPLPACKSWPVPRDGSHAKRAPVCYDNAFPHSAAQAGLATLPDMNAAANSCRGIQQSKVRNLRHSHVRCWCMCSRSRLPVHATAPAITNLQGPISAVRPIVAARCTRVAQLISGKRSASCNSVAPDCDHSTSVGATGPTSTSSVPLCQSPRNTHRR